MDDFLQKESRYVWTGRIALVIAVAAVLVSTLFDTGSVGQNLFGWLAVLAFLCLLGAFYSSRWNRFKNHLTNRGVKVFLFFNRVGEGFYRVMSSIAEAFSGIATYFLGKKSRSEQNIRLILERMDELESSQKKSAEEVVAAIVSLKADNATDAEILSAIREDNARAMAKHLEAEASLIQQLAKERDALRKADDSNAEAIAELQGRIEATEIALEEETKRIDALVLDRTATRNSMVETYTFKDLLTDKQARRKSASLFKLASNIAREDMNEKREYLYELAKFYKAMLDLGYIRENESRFALLFHRDYGGSRDFTAYRRSFHNAVDRLIDYEYEDIQDEIHELVEG